MQKDPELTGVYYRYCIAYGLVSEVQLTFDPQLTGGIEHLDASYFVSHTDYAQRFSANDCGWSQYYHRFTTAIGCFGRARAFIPAVAGSPVPSAELPNRSWFPRDLSEHWTRKFTSSLLKFLEAEY